jgi:hypothetical protein
MKKDDNTTGYVVIGILLILGYTYYINNIQPEVKKAESLFKWF